MTGQVLDSDPHLNCTAAMPGSATRGWRAGDLVADLELRRLRLAETRVVVQEIPFQLLCLLLERGGRPVSRRELHERLWPRYDWDSFERNVNTAVRKLRHAIGDDAREPRLIETLRASGYRWIGPAPVALSSLPSGAGDPSIGQGVGDASGSIVREVTRGSFAGKNGALKRTLWAAAATVLAAAVSWWLLPRSASQSWIVVESAAAAGTIADSPQAAALAASLRAMTAGAAPDGAGEPVHIALTIRQGEPAEAAVSGRGVPTRLDLAGSAFARERLLAEVASR